METGTLLHGKAGGILQGKEADQEKGTEKRTKGDRR